MSRTVAVACLWGAFAFGASAQVYAPDHVWQRWLDWTPGSVPGSAIGAIDADLAGGLAWRHGHLQGGGLASDEPWYENPVTLAVWDDQWWGSNVGGVWARNYFGPGATNDHANPPIDRYTMWHDVSSATHSYAYTSTIDWLNPVGDGAVINMSGSLAFEWYGHFTDDSPEAPLEGVVAKYDASAGTYAVLWSGRVTNPTAGDGLGAASRVEVPMTFVGLRLDQGDFLRFSFRADTPESDVPLWMGMRDGMYLRLVSVVPEPWSLWYLLAGGAALLPLVRRVGRQGAR